VFARLTRLVRLCGRGLALTSFRPSAEVTSAEVTDAALRCYPARWRRRHAHEAAELAALLIRDGNPAASIAWSYLVGAAREWLTPPPAGP
jgi:hypothetical protein